MTTIAVDCDEVLTHTLAGVLEYAKKHYDKERLYDEIQDYMLSKNTHLNITQEQAIELFANYYNSHLADQVVPVE